MVPILIPLDVSNRANLFQKNHDTFWFYSTYWKPRTKIYILSHNKIKILFFVKAFVPFWDVFVVRLMIAHLPTEDVRSFGSWGMSDPRMYKCVWLVQLQSSSLTSLSWKFRNKSYLVSWRGFLQGFVVLPWLHFHAHYHMKPQWERNDGIGQGILGDLSCPFRVHGTERPLPIPDVCCVVHQDSWHVHPEGNQFNVSRDS